MRNKRNCIRCLCGGLCIGVGIIVIACFIPAWLWLLLFGVALACMGLLCIFK